MNVVPVIFTHAPDGPCSLESAAALREAGFADVFVFEDAAQPLAVETRKSMKRIATVMQSNHPNPGGQYGIDCLRGIMLCHSRVISMTGCTHVLKVDSDTVVNRADRILQAACDGVAAAGGTWHGWEFSGCCELVSVAAVHHVFGVLHNPPSWLDRAGCPEDITTGKIAASVGEVRRFAYDESGCFAAGYRYGVTPLAEHARRFDVVTFGNRHLLPGRDCEKRERVAQAMARFRRECRALREA